MKDELTDEAKITTFAEYSNIDTSEELDQSKWTFETSLAPQNQANAPKALSVVSVSDQTITIRWRVDFCATSYLVSLSTGSKRWKGEYDYDDCINGLSTLIQNLHIIFGHHIMYSALG